MKVMDSNFASRRIESAKSEESLKSKYSLRFANSSHEKDYRRAILSDVATSLGFNHQESIITYAIKYIIKKQITHLASTYIISILYMSAYLSTYFEGKSALGPLLYQVLFLSLTTTLISIIYYIYFFKSLT